MLKSLNEDTFLFSALKTNAQLFEASRLLLTADKKIKAFNQFSNDVSKIKKDYNENYLEAEYDFAIGSVLMAERWENFSEGDRYLLQYRTAFDDKVRASHQVLHDTILPKSDPFWDKYFPPNGWRCRCTTVQVLASTNKVSDSKKASEKGEIATTKIGKNGSNKLSIFQFNAGKSKVVFPPKHPYNKVKGAKTVKAKVDQNTRKNNKEKEPVFTPENLEGYESKLGIKVNRSFFSFLNRKVELKHTSKDGKGAFYLPAKNYVHIPIDARRKRSKWYSEAIVYHEYGHAADWHNDIRTNTKVTNLMNKYRKVYAKNKQEKYKDIDKNLMTKYFKAQDDNNHDGMEQVGAAADTLMSLNPNFGVGHSKAYFKKAGLKEAEFIAHAFENTYAGNDIFKELMPDLYKEMKTLIEGFKPR